MMTRTAGVGLWPGAEDGLAPSKGRGGARARRKAEAAEPTNRAAVGTKISARLGALSVRMVATASATFARIGLGSVEARVLLSLGAGPHTASQIGRLIGVDRAAVCRAVQSLLERDLVHKQDGPTREVMLTGEGADLILAINQVTAEREQRLLAGFSAQERAAVLGFLGRLMLNIPEMTALAESGQFASLADGAP